MLGSAGAITLTSLGGCTGVLGSGGEKSVSYRHRYKMEGLSPAANVAGVELGTWASEGLDVTFHESSGSQATVQAVSGGKDEFGNASTAAILQGIEEGAPLTVFGHVLEPMSGVVSLEKTGIAVNGYFSGSSREERYVARPSSLTSNSCRRANGGCRRGG
ncbi:MAG: ABC transporter substrate-binding protein [Halodesulfurarchaeum sp.]